MYFKGTYLRVLSPRTSNGVNLLVGSDDRVIYKESLLPLSSKRFIEQQNTKLPDHLKKKIEVVHSDAQPENVEDLQHSNQVERKKPGPKPKNI